MAKDDFAQVLREREEISITVKGRRTGRAITHPVWFVLRGQTLWLVPVRGSRTEWYRNLLADPTITVRAGRKRRTAAARLAKDSARVGAVVERWRSLPSDE